MLVDEGKVVLESTEPGELLPLGGVALAVRPDPGLEEIGVGEGGRGDEEEGDEGDDDRHREGKRSSEVHQRKRSGRRKE